MSYRNSNLVEDPCEYCGTEEGEMVFDGQFVCKKCSKKLKKERRRNEQKGKVDEQPE